LLQSLGPQEWGISPEICAWALCIPQRLSTKPSQNGVQ
jgi:hypothetical protein